MFSSNSKKIITALLLTSCCFADIGRAQTTWVPVVEQSNNKEKTENEVTPVSAWRWIPPSKKSPTNLVWKPLTPEPNNSAPDVVVWSTPGNRPQPKPLQSANEQQNSTDPEKANLQQGLRWPNGQIMGDEDQIYFRSAYSRGSMIQIGETVYPNLGFNALQRKPGHS